jgi:hypothetical protein
MPNTQPITKKSTSKTQDAAPASENIDEEEKKNQ